MASTTYDCSICTRGGSWLRKEQPSFSPYEVNNGLEGIIARLPKITVLPVESMAHQQLNEGAFDHPCIILMSSPCRHVVFCIPTTSFGGRGFWEKHDGLRERGLKQRSKQYVAIEHPNMVELNEYGTLEHSGPPMPKPSYANLKGGFWIEWQLLQRFDCTQRLTSPAKGKLLNLLVASETATQRTNNRRTVKTSQAPKVHTPSPPATPSPVVEYKAYPVWPVQQSHQYQSYQMAPDMAAMAQYFYAQSYGAFDPNSTWSMDESYPSWSSQPMPYIAADGCTYFN